MPLPLDLALDLSNRFWYGLATAVGATMAITNSIVANRNIVESILRKRRPEDAMGGSDGGVSNTNSVRDQQQTTNHHNSKNEPPAVETKEKEIVGISTV